MGNTSLSRVITGLGVITVGVIAMLGAFDVVDSGAIFRDWWPAAVITLGVVMLVGRNILWGLAVTILGGALLLRTLEYTDLNVFQLFWPVIIILVGLSILFNRTASGTFKTDKTLDDVTAVLGGVESNNTSSDYKGGKATAVMGGVTLDLRKATIKKEATLQVLSFWGGVEVKVPEGWVIKNRTNAILGGVEVKVPTETKKDAPILYIVGDVIMAGVDVKS
ncbi:MAG TPA: DUF5668 domain-containing protein [Candidatus Saccharibacteria bacterium]|nr:DUF5668 domain-containing protein [Candidatus Saccharibacteria bacterium]HRK93790.1 DUF5668 domain-containing protein [Candidatus Saccharibacteria bacterium]